MTEDDFLGSFSSFELNQGVSIAHSRIQRGQSVIDHYKLDLEAFYQRALEVREVVEELWKNRHLFGPSACTTLEGAEAILNDIFNHEDTPEALRLPRIAEDAA